MCKIVAIVTLLMFNKAFCEPPPQYGVPFGGNSNGQPSNNYGTPNYNNGNNHNNNYDDHSEPKSYEFGYQVKDDYTGTNYNRQEQSDGNQVTGEYRVQLPDGRTQIVTYYADWQTGFHADVRYEGTATYPETYKTNNNNNNNGYHGVNNQYGAPNYAQNNNNGYNHEGYNNYNNNNNNNGYNPSGASSTVTVKDLSGPGTAYNVNNGLHNNNDGYSYNNPNNNNYNGGYNNYDNYNKGANY